MILILGAGLLGRYIYQLCSHYMLGDVEVIGYPYNSTPNPMYLGKTKLTEELMHASSCRVIRPAPVCFTLWPHGKLTNGGKPNYKRPKQFKRALNTEEAYIVPPTKVPFIYDKSITKGKVMHLKLEFDPESEVPNEPNYFINYSTIDSAGNIDFVSDKHSRHLIFITVPIEDIACDAKGIGMTFGMDTFNTDSRNFYHLYSLRVITDHFNYFFPEAVSYMYIEDHFFKKPYLKRIIPITRGVYEFQFLSRKRLSSNGKISLVARFYKLLPEHAKCKIVSIKRTATEIRKRNKKVDKYIDVLKSFRVLPVGRFAMQDHSRLHENLDAVNKFINESLLFEKNRLS